MEILLDMDGVLFDFVGRALKLLNARNPYLDPANKGRWDFYNLIGVTNKQLLDAFTEDDWATLDWTEDGQEMLNTLEETFGSENICLLSNPSGRPEAMAGKLRCIKERLPQYEDRYLFGPAKQFAGCKNRILVDDAEHNIEAYGKYPCVLVPRPWNNGLDFNAELHRVRSGCRS